MTESGGQISSGLNALMQQYLATANNIANVNTTGFKRTVGAFQAELSNLIDNLKKETPLSGQIQLDQKIDFSQGTVLRTDRPLDIALEGKGFLTLETPNGTLYTRNGSLTLNSLGQIVDGAGRLVSGQQGPIVIPREVSASEIRINSDGTVLAGKDEVGKLRLADFPGQTDQMKPEGFGAYRMESNAKPQDAVNLRIRQGYLEGSNVKVMEETISLMNLSRLYETNMNILKRQRENTNAALGVANS